MRVHTVIPSSLILLALLFSFAPPLTLEAQSSGTGASASISGDDLCGKWDPVAQKVTKPCDINMAANAAKGMLKLVIILGTPLLFVFVSYRFLMAYFVYAQTGNRQAYTDAVKKAASAIFGFILIVALFGGLLTAVLQFIGVKDAPLSIIKLFSEAIATHAYAAETAQATTRYLPTFLDSTNIYDYLMRWVNAFIRFIVYPVLIIVWVWTGFAFVAAQGKPDALTKAKKWLVGALITTLGIFMLHAFLTALKGTVKEIVPGSTSSTPYNSKITNV